MRRAVVNKRCKNLENPGSLWSPYLQAVPRVLQVQVRLEVHELLQVHGVLEILLILVDQVLRRRQQVRADLYKHSTIKVLLGRISVASWMRHIATDGVTWSVGLTVCLIIIIIIIASGQSNFTKGCIAAAHRRFNCIRQNAPMCIRS